MCVICVVSSMCCVCSELYVVYGIGGGGMWCVYVVCVYVVSSMYGGVGCVYVVCMCDAVRFGCVE